MANTNKRISAYEIIGIPLIGEGVAMLLCIAPSLLFNDGTWWQMAISSLSATIAGALLILLGHRADKSKREKKLLDTQLSFISVTVVWLALSFFGTLPFVIGSHADSFSDAFFETMSGLTSTGATIFSNVEALPPSLLLWRSLMQWLGGFGIILLVLAIVPSLGMNKFSLYTAEASNADNTGKTTTSVRTTVQRTLFVYVSLTIVFIGLLLLSGMKLWDAINLTFANISTGGFSIYSDSIARFTPLQQYILATIMFFGGINFALLYNIFTFRWSQIKNKLDQFSFYLFVLVAACLFVVVALHYNGGYAWNESLRYGIVQTISVLTTTGSVIADTNLWWTPILFLFLILSLCGGMAGSTTGGIKIMRVLILFRNALNTLTNKLHPNAYNPVRLNGVPVSGDLITNVMVTFVVFAFTLLIGLLALMMCGVDATEALGAVFGCATSYGPGLGASGGFGCYADFPTMAKWVCSFLMLLGRLECLTVYLLIVPAFWRR
ncbi:MAG: TrkH family potassium uptake protein [Bacteroidales bacterium]|nr:TrkH family potassium uptake protein [Bacteroidales bacterium]